MKKLVITILLGLMALSLLTGAFAAEVTAVPETAAIETATAEETAALYAAQLDTILALKLESGKTFGEVCTELGVLDTFKAADPRTQIRMIQAQLLLGKLTQADAKLVAEALMTAVQGMMVAGKGPLFGKGFSRNDRFNDRQGMMQGRGRMTQGQNRWTQGQNRWTQGHGRMMQGNQQCPNCPCADTTTPEAVPETVLP